MISIITVVYNGARTIRDTLESVCTQSLPPGEYLIIDGASTDNTLSVVNEYAVRYPFIKIVSEKDSGIYEAMNKGLALASGELIGIINADDWYEPGAFESVYNSYQLNGSGVYYGVQRFLLDEKEFYLERVNPDFIGLKMVSHPSSFVTLDVYMQQGNFAAQYKYSADLELFARYIKNGVPFFPVDSVLSNFRIGGMSSKPAASLESLKIRKNYGMITAREFYIQSVKKRLKLFF